MPKARNKIIAGVASVIGASVISWRAFFPWIGYDLKMMKVGARIGKLMEQDAVNERWVIVMFEQAVERCPKKPFIIFEDRIYTYEYMDEQSNRVANIAMQWGLKVGDTVAIMMQNEPAFIWTFLGLQKLGIGVAFLNYNVKGQPLVHTIKACEAKVLILGEGESILQSVEEVRSDMGDIPVYVHGKNLLLGPGYESWDDLMMKAEPLPVCKAARTGVHFNMPCCYIFTSGTTGLPKPVILTQMKASMMAKFFQLFYFRHDDIVYATTPLYHSAAGGLALMATMEQAATMVLRRKFSAHHYFEDVRRYNVTVIQYIGELCRYLLTVPENPLDTQHKVRLAVGSGLRTDVWKEFEKRFKIPKIYEYFGATDGTAAFMNLENKFGACGRLSPFLNRLSPIPSYLVKCDIETGEPLRNSNGFCIPVKVGEPGLLISGIPPYYSDLKFYKGGKEVNEKKIVRNVFKRGDIYFNFGDMLEVDKDFFVYFKDRVGDTFRWKGENVATYEVSNILTKLDFVHDANVYGVEIPGSEGRAGMAALHLENDLQPTPKVLEQIFHHCQENLPAYAVPLFLRFPKENALTTTLKQQKTQYRKEGYSPELVTDPLFYLDAEKKTYSPLSVDSLQQYMAKARL